MNARIILYCKSADCNGNIETRNQEEQSFQLTQNSPPAQEIRLALMPQSKDVEAIQIEEKHFVLDIPAQSEQLDKSVCIETFDWLT